MERCGNAGFRNPDDEHRFLSTEGKSGKLRPGGRKVGAGGSGLLDLPLGVKIPVQPGTKPVFCRTKLGEKLHQPSPYFDLGDPYCRHLGTEYNSLHDPCLQEYHNRKDNLQNLKKRGLVTKDGNVVCTLKEFNEYRQYLTRLKLEQEKIKRQKEEMFLQEISKLKKCAHRPMASTDKLRPRPVKYIVGKKASPMKRHKPAGPAPTCPNLQAGQRRRRNVALMQHKLQGDSPSTGRAMKLPEKLPKPELGREDSKVPRNIHTAAASKTKTQFPGYYEFRAMSEKEAERLEEETETLLREVKRKLKALDHPVRSSRRAPQKSSQKVLRSAKRAEPSKTPRFSQEQEMARLAWDAAEQILKEVCK
ncbi:fibrous sheath-interacting protein 2 [Lagopus muta]|uniref:fibrous sheath-interacting protein 2 n=1 Tax=Lagopus muta TaxID=64668 RepID=UPI00209DDB14|nr:fibrous sheath-interacting protein 2 [Lagopus muta]